MLQYHFREFVLPTAMHCNGGPCHRPYHYPPKQDSPPPTDLPADVDQALITLLGEPVDKSFVDFGGRPGWDQA